MNFLKRNAADFKALCTFIRYYSPSKRSHYEILNLRKNCTDKEIKDAFIVMSKEYHPDKNKDSGAQEQFVRIVEAYNVLSKPNSRRQYDRLIAYGSQSQRTTTTYQYYRPHYEDYAYRYNQQYTGYSFYESKTKSKDRTTTQETQSKAKSIKKVPNYVIIMLCCGVGFLATILQLFVIRELYVVQRRQAHEKSRFLSEELDRVRSAAQGNANEVQTRLLLEKIVAAANPTIATASLGQALANEKK